MRTYWDWYYIRFRQLLIQQLRIFQQLSLQNTLPLQPSTQAGNTMEDIVNSIRGVIAIMSEISAASVEQTAGIEQVNLAICQMDDVTQQNAALVEQVTAAAASLEEQTQHLTVTVTHFKMDGDNNGANSSFALEPVAKEVENAHAPVGHMVKLDPQSDASSRPILYCRI